LIHRSSPSRVCETRANEVNGSPIATAGSLRARCYRYYPYVCYPYVLQVGALGDHPLPCRDPCRQSQFGTTAERHCLQSRPASCDWLLGAPICLLGTLVTCRAPRRELCRWRTTPPPVGRATP